MIIQVNVGWDSLTMKTLINFLVRNFSICVIKSRAEKYLLVKQNWAQHAILAFNSKLKFFGFDGKIFDAIIVEFVLEINLA